MASEFSLTSSSYEGRYMQLYCKQIKDIASNRSTISWTLSSIDGKAGHYSTGPTTVKINGIQVYYAARKGYGSDSFPVIKGSVSGNLTVNHDEKGDSAIWVEMTTAIYVGKTTTYGGTWTLDNIARASQPSCITWPNTTGDIGYIGGTIYIHANRASTSFTHVAEYFWGNQHGIIANSDVNRIADNVQWTLPLEMCNEIPNSTYGGGTIRLHTYNGSAYIGYKDVNFVAHVPEYDLLPSPTIIGIVNDNGQLDLWHIMVRGFSKIRWNASDPASQYGNTITKHYICLIENKDTFDYADSLFDMQESPSNSGTTNIINYAAGTYRVKMAVMDSRGKWSNFILPDPNDGSKPLKLTIYDYFAPRIQAPMAFRCDEHGKEDDAGTLLNLTYQGATGADLGGRNRITTVYRTRKIGDYWSSEPEGLDPGQNKIIGDFAINLAYEVQFSARDLIGTETYTTISIPLGRTDFNLTPFGAGFGMYHDANKPGVLQSNWDLEIKGNRLSDFVVEAGETDGWRWRKWKSGRADADIIYSGVFDITSAEGAVWRLTVPGGNDIAVALPFEFAETPSVIAQAAGSTLGLWSGQGYGGTTWIGLTIFAAQSGSTNGTVNIHVDGRWK